MARISFGKTIALTLTTSMLLAFAGGCVNQESYDNLRASNDALKARNQELAEQVKALEEARRQLLDRYRSGDLSLDQAKSLIAQLEVQIADRDRQLADMNKRLEGIAIGPLDEATDAALADLAAKYPGILSYDSARGMLRFTSDVTFSSGSFELTSDAKTSISALAKILKDLPSAQQYDLRVVGHTDTQPVSARANRVFKNNLELSAFRAISVRNEMISDGMSSNKVEIAGWGEFRPATDNSSSGNTAANRRVEVYLVKSNWDKALPRTIAPRSATAPRPAAATGARPAPTAGTPGAATVPTVVPGLANPDIMR